MAWIAILDFRRIASIKACEKFADPVEFIVEREFEMKSLPATLLAAAIVAAPPAFAQEVTQAPHISVTGEGNASARPDMAILTMTVLRQAASARAALDENNTATAAVIDALKKAGVEDRDLQTSGFSINPQYERRNNASPTEPPKIVAYQVSNTLTARIRELAKLGTVLDQSVSLGVNQGGSISFTTSDPSKALAEARTEAMQDAIAKAETLTKAAKVRLGKVLEITEQSFQPRPIPLAGARAMTAQMAEAVPVEAGENTYNVQVNVTFEIDQ